jgi:hypothetical protein
MEQKLAEIGSYKIELLEAINVLIERGGGRSSPNLQLNESMSAQFKRLNSSFRSTVYRTSSRERLTLDPTKLSVPL